MRSSGQETEQGITVVEVLVTAVFLAVSLVALGLAVLTGMRGTSDLGERNLVENQAVSYMERLQQMNFGAPDDPSPTPTQLDQFFDDTLDTPDLSLYQLHRPVETDGLQFRLANFESDGLWEVRVNRDINGNGFLDPEEEKDDLLRIEVLFNYRPVLTTFRARPAAAQ